MSTDETSRTLLVTAHPDPGSLTHYIAERLSTALRPGAVEAADLHQEGFDPRFTSADRRAYQEGGGHPPDVVREQQRLDWATDLVLVFPVYWWSVPALLKGWIDRVFVNGWAFEYAATGGVLPKLQRLTTHLLPIAGADSRRIRAARLRDGAAHTTHARSHRLRRQPARSHRLRPRLRTAFHRGRRRPRGPHAGQRRRSPCFPFLTRGPVEVGRSGYPSLPGPRCSPRNRSTAR